VNKGLRVGKEGRVEIGVEGGCREKGWEVDDVALFFNTLTLTPHSLM
jgi:hypothetical protein